MKNSSNRAFTLVEIMIVVLIIGILVAIAVPNFVKARESARTKACVANLKLIDGAAQQWAMDYKVAGTVTTPVTVIGLTPAQQGTNAYIKSMPICPSGGTYPDFVLAAGPTCSIGGSHILP